MTERLYRLEEVTGVLGQALSKMPATTRLEQERELHLFLDDVVRLLKELDGPLRCSRTGNRCGADVWGAGYVCTCQNCQAWLAEQRIAKAMLGLASPND